MTTLANTFQPSPPRFPVRPLRLFTVEKYLRMVELGIFNENDKIELLNGRIVEKISRNPPHDSGLNRLMNLLIRILPHQ